MNIKSYLRGIGAGMIVTAVIMGIANQNNSLSDEEIKSRARDLGMIENNVLSEADSLIKKIPEATPSITDNDIKNSISQNQVSGNTISGNGKIISVGDDSKKPSDNVKTPTDADGETGLKPEDKITSPIDPMPDSEAGFTTGEDGVEIRVIKGDSSVSVSRRIFEAGLVESAVEFDRYLCDNGYDKSISVGTYDVPFESDFETIAKIITRQK